MEQNKYTNEMVSCKLKDNYVLYQFKDINDLISIMSSQHKEDYTINPADNNGYKVWFMFHNINGKEHVVGEYEICATYFNKPIKDDLKPFFDKYLSPKVFINKQENKCPYCGK